MENAQYKKFLENHGFEISNDDSMRLYAEHLKRYFSQEKAISESTEGKYHKVKWAAYREIKAHKLPVYVIFLFFRILLLPVPIKDYSVHDMITYHSINSGNKNFLLKSIIGWGIFVIIAAISFISVITVLISAFFIYRDSGPMSHSIIAIFIAVILLIICRYGINYANKLKSVKDISEIADSSPYEIYKISKIEI